MLKPMSVSPATASTSSLLPGAGGNRWRNRFILAIATVHAVKLLAGILPEAWRPDLLPFGISHAYERITGSKQRWNMFESIPSHHRFSTRIVILEANGSERELGPLLPGFQSWPEPEKARIQCLYDRMFPTSMAPTIRVAWLQEADAQLRANLLLAPGEVWCLETVEDYTRHLFHIGRDGGLYQRKLTRYSLAHPEGIPHPPP